MYDFKVEMQESNLWCLLLTYKGKDRQGSAIQRLPQNDESELVSFYI